MPLTVKERETLKDELELIDKAEAAMGDLPHRLAVPAIRHLTELRDVLCEVLPGGLFTYCESCELPIGCDDEMATDPEGGATLCGDCLRAYEKAA